VGFNVAQKLISSHLIDGVMAPGEEIGIRIDQTLMQDATGTLIMLELEAMELDRVRTELSVQYVDHNLLQEDHRNPDDHLFLLSGCQSWGIWYSRAGNGVSHPLHQNASVSPARLLRGLTAIRPPPVLLACWGSAPEAWRWRWQWRASRSFSRCLRSGAC
jgi:aconitate hydratase